MYFTQCEEAPAQRYSRALGLLSLSTCRRRNLIGSRGNLLTCDEARRIAANIDKLPRNNAIEWWFGYGATCKRSAKILRPEVVATLMFAACILLAIAIAFTF